MRGSPSTGWSKARVAEHPLRPRYGSLAAAAGGLGVILIVLGFSFASGAGRTFALVGGAMGLLLAALWWRSPVRKLAVRTSPEGIAVVRGGETKMALGWDEVERLLISEGSCYLWAGSEERSLLVAGPGVPAPYEVADRAALIETIEASVDPERLERVEDLVTAYRELRASVAESEEPG